MKIAIIGGGITGLTTALALKKLNISCEVFEQAPALNEVGAGIMLQANAMKALDWIGIGDEIRNAGVQLDMVAITDQNLLPVRKANSRFTSDEQGNKITAIHRAKLQEILFQSLPSGWVHLGQQYQKHSIENDKLRVHFPGKTIEADLLLGADGIHSKVRQQLFPNTTTRYSGQTCWRGIADLRLPDKYKTFGIEAWGKQLRFGFINIGGDKVYWFAVTLAEKGRKDDRSNLKAQLLDTFSAFENPVAGIIENTAVEKIIRNDIIDLRRIDHWSKGCVCLLGDAAHATTPNMGQGACQGVEDAYYISNILSRIPDHEKAFTQFEKERRKKVDHIVNTSWQLGKLAHSSIGQPILKLALKMTPDSVLLKQMREMYSIKERFE